MRRLLSLCAAPLAMLMLAPSLHAAERDPFLTAASELAQAQAAEIALAASATPQQRLDAQTRLIVAAAYAEDHEVAAQAYDRAQRLIAMGAKPPADGSLHAWAAVVLSDSRDIARARAALAEAKRLVDAGPGQDSAAGALLAFAEGWTAWGGDDLAGAVSAFRRAHERGVKHLGEGAILTLWAQQVYSARLLNQNPIEGIAAIRQAESNLIGRLPEAHTLWVSQLNNQLQADFNRGRYADAAVLGARLVDRAGQAWGQVDSRLFGVLQMLGLAQAGLGNYAEAEAAVRGAGAIAIANPGKVPRADLAMNHDLLAALILNQGRAGDAIPELRAGLAALDGVDRSDIRWPYIEYHLARAQSLAGDNAAALPIARRTVPEILAKFPPGHPNARDIRTTMAMIELRAGNAPGAYAELLPLAEESASRVLDIFVRERDLAAITQNSKNIFESFAAIALMRGEEEAGFRFAQLSTLSDLGAATARVRYPGDDGRFATLLDAITAARQNEARMRTVLAQGSDPATQAQRVAALNGAAAETATLEARLESEFAAYRDVLRPRPQTIAQARSRIATDAALIVPLSLEDRTVVLALTREGLVWDETPGRFFELMMLAGAVRRSLDAGVGRSAGPDPFDATGARRIHQLLFTPRIRAAIKGKRHLIFSAGGPLSTLPPAVLIARPAQRGKPPRWLVQDFAVSIASGAHDDTARLHTPPRGFAGIGDPMLQGNADAAGPLLRAASIDINRIRDLPPLPSAGRELAAMAGALGAGNALLLRGEQATEAALRAAPLGDFSVIAFATHGLVSGEVPGLDEPALVLTPPLAGAEQGPGQSGARDDGLLRASEVSELKLAADWVILSACNTGASGASSKATYSGLARAFRLAGARSVLLSHWPLRDDVAQRLTVGTVRATSQGTPRAEALRRAQLAVMRDASVPGSSRPAVWAPMVLIDE